MQIHHLWNAKDIDERGAKFEDLIRAFDLIIMNKTGSAPMFPMIQDSLYIDVTP